MPKRINAIRRDETGATAIEYSLIGGMVALVIIAAVTLIGVELQETLQGLANSL